MDIRTIICGVFALAALAAGTTLYALGVTDGAAAAIGLAGTSLGYVVGLNSDPHESAAEAPHDPGTQP